MALNLASDEAHDLLPALLAAPAVELASQVATRGCAALVARGRRPGRPIARRGEAPAATCSASERLRTPVPTPAVLFDVALPRVAASCRRHDRHRITVRDAVDLTPARGAAERAAAPAGDSQRVPPEFGC